jgi:hypothetical protein
MILIGICLIAISFFFSRSLVNKRFKRYGKKVPENILDKMGIPKVRVDEKNSSESFITKIMCRIFKKKHEK